MTADSVNLAQVETRALAIRRVLWALQNYDEWLSWEDMPLLSERAFGQLMRAVEEIAEWWSEHLAEFERGEDVDSAEIESRVS